MAVCELFPMLRGVAAATNVVSLPQCEIPLASLFFNLGVDIRQLAFVLDVVLLRCLFRWPTRDWAHRAQLVTAYGIGAVAMHWLLERIAIMLIPGQTG